MRKGRGDYRTKLAETEALLLATRTWVSVAEIRPSFPDQVLVKFSDGRVASGYWNGKEWRHSTFELWGDVVEWAELPALGSGAP